MQPDTDDDPELAEGGPGRAVRLFVAAFLGVFLIGGLLGIEAWPVTGWKLYARTRQGEFWGWQVRAIGSDGSDRAVDVLHAPAAYHGVNQFLTDFESLSAGQRRAACLALGEVAKAQYGDVTEVLIDHLRARIPTDPAAPPRPADERFTVEQCELER